MKITKRQLRRIIKEERAKLLSEQRMTPSAWANEWGGAEDHDEEGQTIIYLSKEEQPNEEVVAASLPPEWDYEETYDEESWIVYTGEYS